MGWEKTMTQRKRYILTLEKGEDESEMGFLLRPEVDLWDEGAKLP